jgi:anti-sigma factor RsiW
MNDEKFRELLADYLAGELDEQQAAAFRAELEASPERRRLANELQAAAAALEANVLTDDEARRRTEGLELEVPLSVDGRRTLKPPRQYKRLFTVLRYAAVIALAFGTGFLVRGWQSRSPATASAPPPAAEINERYLANFVEATQSFPQSSTFTRSLLMLARE